MSSFSLRRGRGGDVEPLTSLLAEEEVALRGESHWDESDVVAWWRALEQLGETWVVDGEDGITAFLGLFTAGHEVEGWIVAPPALQRVLVEHAESRTDVLGRGTLRQASYAENRTLCDLLEEKGYRIVRRFYRMQIELDGAPPEPQWPQGITCATFDPARVREFHAAVQDAFADNWDFHPMEFDPWQKLHLEAPDFDPSLWLVAWDGDDVAGFARCAPKRWGMGSVESLGVRKPWRKRGLGLALLHAAFRVFYDRGERRVGLGVDAQNESGATRLYERAGMSVAAEGVVYQKELS